MPSHHRHDPQQRVPRSTTFASVAGVGLVIFGVLLSLWQRRGDSSASQVSSVDGPIDGGVLAGLQHLAPTVAGILIAVILVAGILLFKGRRHQS